MNYDVAIIGAGISGLTTAWELSRRGHKVVVLERQQHIGGNAVSERFDGFLMEHGPTTLNAMVPEALELTREIGLDPEKLDMGEGVRKRYLLEGGALHGISTNPAGFLLSSYLSWSGRLSLMSEMFRRAKTGGDDETIHQFATRRFGREFADKVMEPLAAGMFAGDAMRLSLSSVFPKLAEIEKKHGSITRGIIKARKGSEPGKRLYSYRDGVATLPAALSQQLGGSIYRGVTVKSIRRLAEGFTIETSGKGTVLASSVVLATQPHVAAGLVENLDEGSAHTLAKISAPPLSVVYLGYRREQVAHPLDSLGFLSVKGENGILTGAQFCSTLFDHRAPEGYVSIAGYVGGVRNPVAAQMPAADLVRQVHQEFSQLLGIAGEPVVERHRQWALGLPQYEVGHRKLKQQLLEPGVSGLFLTGNYLSGVSVANCIAQARKTAKKVSDFLSVVETDNSGVDHVRNDRRA